MMLFRASSAILGLVLLLGMTPLAAADGNVVADLGEFISGPVLSVVLLLVIIIAGTLVAMGKWRMTLLAVVIFMFAVMTKTVIFDRDPGSGFGSANFSGITTMAVDWETYGSDPSNPILYNQTQAGAHTVTQGYDFVGIWLLNRLTTMVFDMSFVALILFLAAIFVMYKTLMERNYMSMFQFFVKLVLVGSLALYPLVHVNDGSWTNPVSQVFRSMNQDGNGGNSNIPAFAAFAFLGANNFAEHLGEAISWDVGSSDEAIVRASMNARLEDDFLSDYFAYSDNCATSVLNLYTQQNYANVHGLIGQQANDIRTRRMGLYKNQDLHQKHALSAASEMLYMEVDYEAHILNEHSDIFGGGMKMQRLVIDRMKNSFYVREPSSSQVRPLSPWQSSPRLGKVSDRKNVIGEHWAYAPNLSSTKPSNLDVSMTHPILMFHATLFRGWTYFKSSPSRAVCAGRVADTHMLTSTGDWKDPGSNGAPFLVAQEVPPSIRDVYDHQAHWQRIGIHDYQEYLRQRLSMFYTGAEGKDLCEEAGKKPAESPYFWGCLVAGRYNRYSGAAYDGQFLTARQIQNRFDANFRNELVNRSQGTIASGTMVKRRANFPYNTGDYEMVYGNFGDQHRRFSDMFMLAHGVQMQIGLSPTAQEASNSSAPDEKPGMFERLLASIGGFVFSTFAGFFAWLGNVFSRVALALYPHVIGLADLLLFIMYIFFAVATFFPGKGLALLEWGKTVLWVKLWPVAFATGLGLINQTGAFALQDFFTVSLPDGDISQAVMKIFGAMFIFMGPAFVAMALNFSFGQLASGIGGMVGMSFKLAGVAAMVTAAIGGVVTALATAGAGAAVGAGVAALGGKTAAAAGGGAAAAAGGAGKGAAAAASTAANAGPKTGAALSNMTTNAATGLMQKSATAVSGSQAGAREDRRSPAEIMEAGVSRRQAMADGVQGAGVRTTGGAASPAGPASGGALGQSTGLPASHGGGGEVSGVGPSRMAAIWEGAVTGAKKGLHMGRQVSAGTQQGLSTAMKSVDSMGADGLTESARLGSEQAYLVERSLLGGEREGEDGLLGAGRKAAAAGGGTSLKAGRAAVRKAKQAAGKLRGGPTPAARAAAAESVGQELESSSHQAFGAGRGAEGRKLAGEAAATYESSAQAYAEAGDHVGAVRMGRGAFEQYLAAGDTERAGQIGIQTMEQAQLAIQAPDAQPGTVAKAQMDRGYLGHRLGMAEMRRAQDLASVNPERSAAHRQAGLSHLRQSNEQYAQAQQFYAQQAQSAAQRISTGNGEQTDYAVLAESGGRAVMAATARERSAVMAGDGVQQHRAPVVASLEEHLGGRMQDDSQAAEVIRDLRQQPTAWVPPGANAMELGQAHQAQAEGLEVAARQHYDQADASEAGQAVSREAAASYEQAAGHYGRAGADMEAMTAEMHAMRQYLVAGDAAAAQRLGQAAVQRGEQAVKANPGDKAVAAHAHATMGEAQLRLSRLTKQRAEEVAGIDGAQAAQLQREGEGQFRQARSNLQKAQRLQVPRVIAAGQAAGARPDDPEALREFGDRFGQSMQTAGLQEEMHPTRPPYKGPVQSAVHAAESGLQEAMQTQPAVGELLRETGVPPLPPAAAAQAASDATASDSAEDDGSGHLPPGRNPPRREDKPKPPAPELVHGFPMHSVVHATDESVKDGKVQKWSNYGRVVGQNEDRVLVHFVSKKGKEYTKAIDPADLAIPRSNDVPPELRQSAVTGDVFDDDRSMAERYPDDVFDDDRSMEERYPDDNYYPYDDEEDLR